MIPLYQRIPVELCSHLTVDEDGDRRCLLCGVVYYRQRVLDRIQAAMRKRQEKIWQRMHSLEREEIES